MYTFSMFEVGGILKLECFPCLSVGCRILTKLLEEMRNFFLKAEMENENFCLKRLYEIF